MSSSKKSNILVVDDNPADHALFINAIEESGISAEIKWIKDGETALKLFRKIAEGNSSAQPPDLIFLDINLPRYSGLEILKKIRKMDLTRSIPFIILSSSVLQSEKKEAIDLGCQGFIEKTLNVDEFNQNIFATLKQWL